MAHKDPFTLMCKKIAQLTKVIYHLNTVNEEHIIEMDAVQKHHKAEMSEALRDAAAKLGKFKDAIANKKDDANAKALVEQQRRKHEKEKADCLSKWKRELAESEASLHREYGEKMKAMGREVTLVKAKFSEAARAFDGAASKLSHSQGEAAREVDRVKRDHEAAVGAVEAAARRKYDAMVATHQGVNDDLRASIEDREAEAAAAARREAEAVADVRFGQLRAEVHGERETEVAALKRAQAEASRMAEQEVVKERRLAQQRLEALERTKGQFEEERTELKRRELEAEAEAADWRRRFEDGDSQRTGLRKEMGLLRAELDEARAGSKDLAEGDAAARREIAELKRRRDGLEAQLKAEVGDALQRQRRAEAQLSAATTKVDALQASLAEARGSMEALQRRLEKELNAKDAKVAELETRLRDVKADGSKRTDEAEQRWKRAESQVRDAEAQRDEAVAALKRTGLATSESAAAHRAEVSRLEQGWTRKLDEAQAKHRGLVEAQRAKFDAEAGGLRAEWARREAEWTALAGEKERALAAAASAAANKADAERATLVKQKADLEQNLVDALAKAADDGALKDLRTSHEAAQADLRRARAALDAKENETRRSKEVADSLKDQVEELRQELESAAAAAKQRLAREKAKLEEEGVAKAAAAVDRARKALLADAQEASKGALVERTKMRQGLEAEMARQVGAVEHRLAETQRLLDETAASLDKDRIAFAEERLKLEMGKRQLRDDADRAAADHADWRRATEAARRDVDVELDKVRADLARTAEALGSLKRVKEALDEANATRIAALEGAVARLQKDLEARAEDVRRGQGTATALRAELSKRDAALRELDATLDKTRRDDAALLARSLEDKEEMWQKHFDDAARAAAGVKGDLETQLADTRLHAAEELRTTVEAASAKLDATRRAAEDAATDLTRRHEDSTADLRHRHAAECDDLRRDAQRRHDTLLEAFEADLQRHQTVIQDLEASLAQWKTRFETRESRPEDLEAIRQLQQDLQQQGVDLETARAELVYFKRELINREDNFNKKFNAQPNVGIMQVIKPKPSKSQSFNAGKLPPQFAR